MLFCLAINFVPSRGRRVAPLRNQASPRPLLRFSASLLIQQMSPRPQRSPSPVSGCYFCFMAGERPPLHPSATCNPLSFASQRQKGHKCSCHRPQHRHTHTLCWAGTQGSQEESGGGLFLVFAARSWGHISHGLGDDPQHHHSSHQCTPPP